MSLLDDVSIVVTPNGYKAGELYAVIPVPTEGAELVPSVASIVNAGGGTITQISGNSYSSTSDGTSGSAVRPKFDLSTTAGKRYKLTITPTGTISGTVNFDFYDGSSYLFQNYDFTTTKEIYFIDNGSVFGAFDGTQTYNISSFTVSVKEYTSADMDVTRATAATRVDEDGLVNYAEIVSDTELVTNGDFASDLTGWTGYGTRSATGGIATIGASANSGIYQGILTEGVRYTVTVNVTSYDGVGTAQFANSNGSNIYTITETGIQTFIFTHSIASPSMLIRGRFNALFSVSSVSVKELTRDNVPRIDYTGGGCPHILAEPQRTNLVTDSKNYTGYFSNSGTLIYNNTTSPDGLENGAKNYVSTTGSFKGLSKSYGSTLSNTAYTLSIFAKAGEFENLFFYNVGAPSGNGGVWFNLSTGNVGTTHASWSNTKMEDLGNGWYRCSAVITPSGTSDNLYILLSDADNSVAATANGTDGYYIYGAQLELGSYATSYIPTSGSTVTRNQDIFTRDGIGSLINSEEGVLFAELKTLANDSTNGRISLSDGTTANRMLLYSAANSIKFYVGVSGQSALAFTVTGVITEFNKVAISFKENDMKFYLNGVLVYSNTSAATFLANSLNTLQLADGNGQLNFFGKVKQLQVYKTALTDTELATLTTI